MMRIFLVVKLFIWITSCITEQTFQYLANDTLYVQPQNTMQISLQILTASNEYLNQNVIQGTLIIEPFNVNPVNYNLIFFLCSNEQGMNCFQNWIVNGQNIASVNCSQINDDYSIPTGCSNFSGCGPQSKSIQLQLTQQIYKGTSVFIENTSLNETLQLNTSITINLQASNKWFYLGIGLICYFIISLVIYSGILFKAILKYKSVKKKFQQFRLTQYQQSSTKTD